MKKIITVFVAASVFLGAMISASAATLLRTNGGNGAVKLTINLNDGYVGALDATLELSGKVTLDTVDWDASLSSEYVKKHTYDKASNTVRIYVASGNVAKNLADKDGNVVIGVIKVKAARDKEKFNVGIKRLSVTNMDYEVRNITTLENNKTNDFTFELEDVSDNNNNSGNNGNNNSGSSNGSGNNSGSNSNSNTNSSNNGSSQSYDNGYGQQTGSSQKQDAVAKADKEKSEAVKDNFGNSDPIKYNSATGSYDTPDMENDNTIWYIVIGSLIVVLIAVGGYVTYRQKQKA